MRSCEDNRIDRTIVKVTAMGRKFKRGFSYSHRSQMLGFMLSFAFPKSMTVLQTSQNDEKFNLELKRGYYSAEKAKKYFQ